MADLAVGLAKSVVEGTLSKAQAAIAEEAKLRHSAKRDLVFITGEFQMMQSFLKVANTERVENPVVMTWVRQIRELAYDVEDCIEFVVHLDKKPSWWWRMVPGWMLCCPVKPSRPLDEAVDEIEQLKARVQDVSTRNARYSLISDTGSKPQQQQQPGPSAMLIPTWRRQQQGDLTQLFPKIGDGLQVISVTGTGGDLGVTSVIWKAYNDTNVCKNFTCRAWVKVIHPFNPHVFVCCLIDQFDANRCKEERGGLIIGIDALKRSTSQPVVHGHLEELARKVNEERYLIVLEDLSSMSDWDAIRNFFPSRNNGSCIIVSTQQFEVASLSVGYPWQIWEINQFSVDHSVYAFYKEGSQPDDEHKDEKTNNSASASTSENKAADDLITIGSPIRRESEMVGPVFNDKDPENEISQCDGDDRNKTKYLILSSKKKSADDWISKNQIVGRETEMHDLRQFSVEVAFDATQVMSVWGIIGVGKSTLIKTLFCDRIHNDYNLKSEGGCLFDRYGWVDVSYPFNLRDFSRSLLLNFSSESLETNETTYNDMMVRKNSIAECRGTLKLGKCLVVIDGLRSIAEWELIHSELVSGSSENCIIVITSDASVAKRCRGDKEERVSNVKGLEADAAYKLFQDKVSASEHPLPSLSVAEVAELKELVSKCGGLPKVIVEIASTLGAKSVEQMDSARSLSNKFMHDLESNREFESLQGLFTWMHTYFRICPDSLKPCIFYMSIFPRDRILRRRRLVRRWIAEGYSRDNDKESAEENAEKQFSDLLDLSIIQRPPQKVTITAQSNSRMISCQVNGFIREYIVSKQIDENLVFELGGYSTITTQRTGRHLVILDSWKRDRIVFESMEYSRLRSLTVFGEWKSFFISKSMKMLRVLDLENASGLEEDDLMKVVKVLLRLKFLSLRGHLEIFHLPGSLHKMRQLQTLDVRGTSITTLPEKITKLEKMQYIRAGNKNFQPKFSASNVTVEVAAPDSSSGGSWLPVVFRCQCTPASTVDSPAPILSSNQAVDVPAPDSSSGCSWLPEVLRCQRTPASTVDTPPPILSRNQAIDVSAPGLTGGCSWLPILCRSRHLAAQAPVLSSNRPLQVMAPDSPSGCSWLPKFCRCHGPRVGVVVPMGIGKLTALHTLGVVDVAASGATTIMEELTQLTQLRKLGVSGINRKNSRKFFSAIKGHVHLESLSVHLDKDTRGCFLRKDKNNQGFLDGMISLPCENLRSIKLYGLEDKLPNWEAKKLTMLIKLELEMSTLTEDGIKIIGLLPELCILRIKQLQNGQLHFRVIVHTHEDHSYKKVKVLEIACSSSELSVTFGKKTMKELELLKVDCPSASSKFNFSGMKSLRELKVVALVSGPNAETQKQQIDHELENHPNENKPVVKLEDN